MGKSLPRVGTPVLGVVFGVGQMRGIGARGALGVAFELKRLPLDVLREWAPVFMLKGGPGFSDGHVGIRLWF